MLFSHGKGSNQTDHMYLTQFSISSKVSCQAYSYLEASKAEVWHIEQLEFLFDANQKNMI